MLLLPLPPTRPGGRGGGKGRREGAVVSSCSREGAGGSGRSRSFSSSSSSSSSFSLASLTRRSGGLSHLLLLKPRGLVEMKGAWVGVAYCRCRRRRSGGWAAASVLRLSRVLRGTHLTYGARGQERPSVGGWVGWEGFGGRGGCVLEASCLGTFAFRLSFVVFGFSLSFQGEGRRGFVALGRLVKESWAGTSTSSHHHHHPPTQQPQKEGGHPPRHSHNPRKSYDTSPTN